MITRPLESHPLRMTIAAGRRSSRQQDSVFRKRKIGEGKMTLRQRRKDGQIALEFSEQSFGSF
jgi:hypothetical protein